MKKLFLLILSSTILTSCTYIDNYMLGKDNTPKPKPLENYEPKFALQQKWSQQVGKSGTKQYLRITPEIVGDNIYTAMNSGTIASTKKEDGTINWATKIDEKILSGPTVKNDYLIVTTNRSKVMVLDRKNGKPIWQTQLSNDALAKPVIAHNEKLLVKTIDGKLLCYKLQNGEKLWETMHGAPNVILKASSSPVIVDNVALVGFADGRLDAIDLNTGNIIWQHGVAFARGTSDIEKLVDIDADPVISGKIAYLGTYQGFVGAMSLENGQFLWKKPASTYKNISIDNENLYLTDSSDIVWAYGRYNGLVKWKQDSFKARGLTSPIIMGNKLVIADTTGYVHVLSKITGEVLSRGRIGGSITANPVIDSSKIYVQTSNGELTELAVG